MKPSAFSRMPVCILLSVLALAPGPQAPAAEPKTDIADAIKKLADQANYSWTVTQKTSGSETAARRDGGIEGQAEKGGLVLVKTTSGDTSYQAAFKGEKVVVNFNEDWVEPSELPVDNGRIEQRLKALKTTPVEQATSLAEKSKDLKAAKDGEYSGELTSEAALAFFKLLGRRAMEATEAKGTVKFWVKDGRLAKYEFAVQGKITTGTDKKEVEISRTTTVEVKEVGSTKISLPEGARNRLS
ncbi:MAG TPA: hypothetical protein VNU68_24550 [Verrucomicrobiae bacterium]|nr:hypothetical protein [Verrucomicrobiae bacterium]